MIPSKSAEQLLGSKLNMSARSHEHQRRRPHCAFFTAQPSSPHPPSEAEPEPRQRKAKAATRKVQPSDQDAEDEEELQPPPNLKK